MGHKLYLGLNLERTMPSEGVLVGYLLKTYVFLFFLWGYWSNQCPLSVKPISSNKF